MHWYISEIDTSWHIEYMSIYKIMIMIVFVHVNNTTIMFQNKKFGNVYI